MTGDALDRSPRRARQVPHRAWDRITRPYAMTGGRTVPTDGGLAVEALVEMTWEGWDARDRLQFEAREIIALSSDTMSVAELAAHLQVPLGVARVLVSDLKDAGYVVVHPPAGTSASGSADPTLLEKVLHGLRSR